MCFKVTDPFIFVDGCGGLNPAVMNNTLTFDSRLRFNRWFENPASQVLSLTNPKFLQQNPTSLQNWKRFVDCMIKRFTRNST